MSSSVTFCVSCGEWVVDVFAIALLLASEQGEVCLQARLKEAPEWVRHTMEYRRAMQIVSAELRGEFWCAS